MLLHWNAVLVLLVTLAACLTGTTFVHAKAQEIGVGVDGEVEIVDLTKSAVFLNTYPDKILHLFWRGEDGSVAKMGKLGKGGSATLNTFIDHVFFATFDSEATQLAHPHEV